MSGLYNILFGVNALAIPLMGALRFKPSALGRFRDCYLGRGPDGALEVHVFTRNGGNNRQHYGEGIAGPRCACTGCTMTHNVTQLPGYLRDFDDPFDSTYATVCFEVPSAVSEALEKLVANDPTWIVEPFEKRFNEALGRVNGSVDQDKPGT